MTFREIRLRALMADNDFRHAARTGTPDDILRLWRRKEYWSALLRFEQLRIEKGKKFNWFHEFKVWQKERRAA